MAPEHRLGHHARLQLPLPVSLVTGPVDVYHSPDFVLPPVGGARSLLTVHDLAFLLQPECADAHLREYLERTVPRSVRRADFVVADSENTRNDVICLLGMPADRVAVVPGGARREVRGQAAALLLQAPLVFGDEKLHAGLLRDRGARCGARSRGPSISRSGGSPSHERSRQR